jgi:hypothetical protein
VHPTVSLLLSSKIIINCEFSNVKEPYTLLLTHKFAFFHSFLPEIEDTDDYVKNHVNQMIAHGLQSMQQVVEAEREDAQRSVRLVTLLLKSQKNIQFIIIMPHSFLWITIELRTLIFLLYLQKHIIVYSLSTDIIESHLNSTRNPFHPNSRPILNSLSLYLGFLP